MVAVAAGAAAVSLLAPWVRSGRVDRSTIELLESASALDVLDGRAEIGALAAWYIVPVLAAGAAVSAGWHRKRLTAAFALPMGPLMLFAWWAVASSPLDTRWGAALGGLLGACASVLATLLLIEARHPAEGRFDG